MKLTNKTNNKQNKQIMKELKALNKRTAPKSVAPEKIIQFGEGDFRTIVSFSLVLIIRWSWVCKPTNLFCPT